MENRIVAAKYKDDYYGLDNNINDFYDVLDNNPIMLNKAYNDVMQTLKIMKVSGEMNINEIVDIEQKIGEVYEKNR